MIKFSIRLFDLELVSCDVNLIENTEKPTTAKIIIWVSQKSSVAVAYWKRDNDNGFGLNFNGSLPFDEGKEVFWELAKIGQDLLESCLEISSDFTEGGE